MTLLSLKDTPFVIKLSFDRFIGAMELNATESQALLLEEVALHPELRKGITELDVIEQHLELISRLLAEFFPKGLTFNEIKALSIPYTNTIFNHTERFKSLLAAAGDSFEMDIRGFEEHQFYVLSCCLILNQYYGTQLDFGKPLFYDIPMQNGVAKHYRIMYNADYLEIEPNENAVKLNPEEIDLLINNFDNLELWKEKFPSKSWTLKGFALMTLFDATIENAVSIFKEKLLKLNADDFQRSIESIFQSIYRTPDLQVGITLYHPATQTFGITTLGQRIKSFILPDNQHRRDHEVLCPNSYRRLIEEKSVFVISDALKFQESEPYNILANRLVLQDVHSFILAPIVRNGVLLGVLEVVSPRSKDFNSINANKLDEVIPFLTDTIERLISELRNQVQVVIQEKFTTIHPSVYWKFNAEAQRIIYNRQLGLGSGIAEIIFPEVYPLYGQIDIKSSSEARNQSIQQDFSTQLNQIAVILEQMEHPFSPETEDQEKETIASFINVLALPLQASTEQQISSYIENKIHPLFYQLKDQVPNALIHDYFRCTDEKTGSFHISRRRYENTVAVINEEAAKILDQEQLHAQEIFPHYYERFKTDGVEHNLYIGASITPNLSFGPEKLHELRLWQLRTLVKMEIAHHHLKAHLPYPLEVTTLLLSYHSAITIRFRMDEKRFDVDGSYNARFEIAKKRIDKANIKNTTERITEAGKVTVVYTNDAEYEEYLGHIRTLEREKLLTNEIEHLEVENLVGLSGLKALRVKILHGTS